MKVTLSDSTGISISCLLFAHHSEYEIVEFVEIGCVRKRSVIAPVSYTHLTLPTIYSV